jgi:hypothetical protein
MELESCDNSDLLSNEKSVLPWPSLSLSHLKAIKNVTAFTISGGATCFFTLPRVP